MLIRIDFSTNLPNITNKIHNLLFIIYNINSNFYGD
jgi:hypothetical protein